MPVRGLRFRNRQVDLGRFVVRVSSCEARSRRRKDRSEARHGGRAEHDQDLFAVRLALGVDDA